MLNPLCTHSELLAPLHIQYVFNDNIFTHACNYMYMHIHMYTTDTLIHSCTDTHKSYAVTCAHTYTQTRACQQQTHACTHLHSYTQTHTCTCTLYSYTQTYTQSSAQKHGTRIHMEFIKVVICCRWHYSCTDLGSMLQQNLVPMATVYTVLGLGFYSNPDPALRGFYVDEVSFSSVSRSLVDVSHTNAASLSNLYLCK